MSIGKANARNLHARTRDDSHLLREIIRTYQVLTGPSASTGLNRSCNMVTLVILDFSPIRELDHFDGPNCGFASRTPCLMSAFMQTIGMPPSRVVLMRLLAKSSGDVASSDLARQLGTKNPVVSRQLAEMEADGLVRVHPDPSDLRRNYFRLSPKGRKAFRASHDRSRRLEHALLSQLGSKETVIASDVLARPRKLISSRPCRPSPIRGSKRARCPSSVDAGRLERPRRLGSVIRSNFARAARFGNIRREIAVIAAPSCSAEPPLRRRDG